MNFEEYSEQAYSTAMYPNKGENLVYPAIKLAGEAGETADKIGKHWRNHAKTGNVVFAVQGEFAPHLKTTSGSEFAMSARSYSEEQKAELVKELGDVLWYINAIAIELGVSLEHVAETNIQKLAGRAERGTILSSGDNR